MPLTLHPCQPPDIPPLFALISRTFAQTAPFLNAIFPAHETPRGRDLGASVLLAELSSDRKARFFKVVDTELGDEGEMVGQACWLLYDGVEDLRAAEEAEGKGLEGDGWVDEEEKAFARWMWGEFMGPRLGAVKGAGGRLLAPEHQRRGVGSMLLRWGTELADQMGIDTVVEATAAGVPVYEKHGFVTEHQMRFDCPERWADRPKPELAFMRRTARK
ncbi:MAG: hypothetical protein Q9182_003803 [Xanthomendoza sp. 2 TL-2023]